LILKIRKAAMTTNCARSFTKFALLAAVVFGAPSNCAAQPIGPVQSATAPNGFPSAGCSRPADEEALRIERLVEFAEKSRSMAVQNPLMLADAGYYEAELAASRRCLQAIAAR
jgi:hypothetical protein